MVYFVFRPFDFFKTKMILIIKLQKCFILLGFYGSQDYDFAKFDWVGHYAFNALTLLAGRQVGHPVY